MDLFSSIVELPWIRERTVLGVEAVSMDKGSWSFRGVKAKRKGSGLEVLDRDKGGESVSELRERFGNSFPVVLVISGKGTVHKPIAEDKGPVKDRMDQVLPNADPEAFYFQEYKNEKGDHWGSLVRREQVDELLNAFKEEGFLVTAVSFGPFATFSYWELLFGEEEGANFGPFELRCPAEGPLELKRAREEHPFEVRIDEEDFDQDQVLALSALFEEVLDRGDLLSPDIPLIEEGRREQDHKNLFQKGGVAAIAFFLVLLLGNYVAYELAGSRLSGMKEELRMKEGLLEELEQLEEAYDSKERILKAVSAGSEIRFSYFADRIARRVPKEVLLTRLELAPITEKIEEGERIRPEQGKVLLEGTTTEGTPLNRMMRSLQEIDRVNGASLLDYQQRQRKEGASFELELQLR